MNFDVIVVQRADCVDQVVDSRVVSRAANDSIPALGGICEVLEELTLLEEL